VCYACAIVVAGIAMTVRRICPSITEIQAFESASRHLSFTKVASELHCTQGAVSRQIASLEETVGVTLFERTAHGLVLTVAGASYLPVVRRVLTELEAATLQMLNHSGVGGSLTVTSLPTLSAKWLIPKLADFYRNHPEVALDFLPFSRGYDLSDPHIDVAIRYGEGNWAGCRATYLLGREAIVIVPPQIAAAQRKKLKACDLPAIGLLHHTSLPHAWADWFSAQNAHDTNPHVGKRLEQFTLIIQAVSANLGAAVVPHFLVSEDIAQGRVFAPFARGVTLSCGYYACVPEAKKNLPAAQTFVRWLVAMAQKTTTDALVRKRAPHEK
jgi:LysR family transcriptional regulator, glycine cleavage system transcriptional activator